jgi:class 3 adenylate cyclase
MPTALRTYLFTNLLGYGQVLQVDGDAAAARLLRVYRRLVKGQIPAVPTATIQEVSGDTIYAAFRFPGDAIRAALAIVRAVEGHNRRKPEMPIRIGTGIHAGQAVRQGRDYVGSAVAISMRLSHAAEPEQILITDTVYGLVRTGGVAPMNDLGVWGPRGFGQTVHVYEVVAPRAGTSAPRPRSDLQRLLLAVLFTDIVLSTHREVALGDRSWKLLVERHHAVVRAELQRHHGREVDTAGDGFFATFDAPSRAIECSLAIRDGVRTLGLDIRVGIHVGECEIVAGKVGGIAVVVGARTREAASPGEVLVTQTVKDVVSGGSFVFATPRVRSLKGIPGKWRLYGVEAGAPSEPSVLEHQDEIT